MDIDSRKLEGEICVSSSYNLQEIQMMLLVTCDISRIL